MTPRIPFQSIAICIILSVFLLAAMACSDTEEPVAPAAAQPAPTAATQPTSAPQATAPTVAPAAAPTAAPTAATQPAASNDGTKEIFIVTPFAPSSNGAIETDDAGILMSAGATETMLKIDFDGQVKPYLAQSWSLSGDDTWEFTLREDVNFHDGAHFDGQAIVASVSYLLGVPNPPRGFTADNIASVDAPTDYTVVMRTVEPDYLMPSRFATRPTAALSPVAYQERGDGPPNPIGTGTGPFVIEGDISIESIKYVRNEDYWDGIANLSAGETLFVPDGLVRAAMLETGEVDLLNHLAISQLPVFEGNSDFVMHRAQQPRTVTLNVNNRNGLFSDLNVRKAAQHAVDKDAIVASVLEGVGAPAVGPFAPSEAWGKS